LCSVGLARLLSVPVVKKQRRRQKKQSGKPDATSFVRAERAEAKLLLQPSNFAEKALNRSSCGTAATVV
jgi:hypothetical protein